MSHTDAPLLTSCSPCPRDNHFLQRKTGACCWVGEQCTRAFASGLDRPQLTTSVDSHCSMSSMRQAWVTGIWKDRGVRQ